MNRSIWCALIVALVGCASNKSELYAVFIESEFRVSENFKGSGKVDISSIIIDKTKEQFITESNLIIEDSELEDYEIINYQVTYDGSYWLEKYQVFRYCDRSGCKHKFILIIGIYA